MEVERAKGKGPCSRLQTNSNQLYVVEEMRRLGKNAECERDGRSERDKESGRASERGERS